MRMTTGWRRPATVASVLGMAGVVLAAGGDLDSTFGTGGVVQYAASGNWIADCAVQADGKIIVASPDGTGSGGQPLDWRIDRRLSTGALDTTWGTGGVVTLLSGGDPKDVTIDASGRVVAGGRSTVTTTGKGGKTTSTAMATVARLTSSGAVDFTTNLSVSGASAATAMSVAVDGTGRIVVAGTATYDVKGKGGTTIQNGVFVARLTSSGALDASFGSNGITASGPQTGNVTIYPGALALQSDGKIVVGGGHDVVESNVGYHVWDITRYAANGAVDTAFGVVHGPGAHDINLAGLTVDASDRIVAAGARFVSLSASDMMAARYTADGAVDASFGDGGAVVIHDTANSHAGYPSIDASGRITLLAYLLPTTSPVSYELVTVRMDATGALDESYGSGGITAPFVLGAYVEPRGMALTSDDKVVAVGDAYDASNVHTWFVARFLGD
jgi:uncharacterized delta-60 repeat protein